MTVLKLQTTFKKRRTSLKKYSLNVLIFPFKKFRHLKTMYLLVPTKNDEFYKRKRDIDVYSRKL